MAEGEARALAEALAGFETLAVAVSGGVDSMTLAHAAVRRLGPARVHMMHAVSKAVPAEATARVRDHARRHGWRLTVLDAGEMADPAYRRNPVNRCFYCKTNLYGAIAARTRAPIASGANTDDLGDYRPGLIAASQHGVRHPFIEAGLGKPGVRRLARRFGLDDLAVLPASPCLSSRIETGLAVEPARLALVHAVEGLVREQVAAATIRCRVRRDGLVVELDAGALGALAHEQSTRLTDQVTLLAGAHGHTGPVRLAAYVRGSAFVHSRRPA